jgi:hypothetical protein
MPRVPELTVDIALQPQDVYHPFIVTRSNLMRWVLALFACYLTYTTRPIWSAGSLSGSVSILLELPLFCAFVVLAIFSWPYLRVRSMFHEHPSLRRSRRVSFSADGMHMESEDAQGDYKWSLFYQIVETPKTFLFMQSTRAATYIPKRCLSKSDDIVILRRLIRDNFMGKRRLRNE